MTGFVISFHGQFRGAAVNMPASAAESPAFDAWCLLGAVC